MTGQPPKYVLHCAGCNYKRFTDGADLGDLFEIKRAEPMRFLPKVDKYTKRVVVSENVKRPKMYRCPKCGRTLKGFPSGVKSEVLEDGQTSQPNGREAGPEGHAIP